MTDYFMAHGVTDPTGARQQSIIALGNAVKRQALVLVFSDTFAVIGIVLITAGIAVLLTGKPKTQAAGLLTRGAPHALATNDQVPKSRRELKTRLSGGVPRQRKSDLAAEAGRLERARDLGAEVVLQRLLQQDRAKAFPSLFDRKPGHAAFLPV